MIKRTLFAVFCSMLLLAVPANAANPYSMADGTWISLMGTVKSVSADQFELDYGPATVTVEMDDGDRDADAYALLPGDDVTVTGVVDDDFFETTSIEAGSVYVDKLDTYFFASIADEEDAYPYAQTSLINEGVLIQGKVSKVDGRDFTIDTGMRTFTIDTREMAYDPLDDVGYQRIETGDLVSVTGHFERDLFEGRELVAQAVTTLLEGSNAK